MTEPRSHRDIVETLEALATHGIDAWRTDADVFFAPLGDSWSPADNVRHLTKSTAPVARALALPQIVLRGLFGRADGSSRSYPDLVSTYRAALEAGGRAGRFAPDPVPPPDDPIAGRERILDDGRDAIARLILAAERWSDPDLDRFRLPHPLLGKLTVREMLFFTIYHHSHHRSIVARRLEPRDARIGGLSSSP